MGHHILLVPILAVAVLTIMDDLRRGKIFNRRLLTGLAVGVLVYGTLWVIEASGAVRALAMGLPQGARGYWPGIVAQNLVIALGAGVVMWLLGIWAAGDAKLFALYAFLVPPACYTRSWLPAFPALPMLINVFALVFAFLIVDLLRTGIPALVRTLGDAEARGKAFHAAPGVISGGLPVLLVFMALLAGIRSLREVSREGLLPILHIGDFTLYVILFMLFKPLTMLTRKRWGAIAFTVISTAAIAFLGWRHGLGYLPKMLQPGVMAIVLIVFARAYPKLGSTSFKVKVNDLAPGMMLGRETLMALRTREAREALERGGEETPFEEPGTTAKPSRFGEMTAEGLSAEQVRYIRTRWMDDEALVVERTIPFSPFLAAGALVTYFLGGPLTSFIRIG